VRCLDSEKKLNVKITDLETNYDELKEKHDGLESELEDLKSLVDGQLVNEANSSPKEEAEKVANEVVVNTDEAAPVEMLMELNI